MDVNYNPCYQKMRIWKIVGGVVDWHQCQMENKRNKHLACRKCMMRIIITAENPPQFTLISNQQFENQSILNDNTKITNT
jgi:hypothetical protein